MKSKVLSIVAAGIERAWLESLLPFLREALFDERTVTVPGARYLLEFWKYFFKLAQIESIRERLPEFDPHKTNISWIPINRTIEGGGDVALSEQILDRLIEKAKHRVIVNFCGCRKAMNCRHYPDDIGCLMMGESALLIPEKSRREVGVEEAKAHVRTALKAGLVPITGKARIDNDIFMIPDESKLLTVCLCCECCCITRFTRHIPPQVLNQVHHPVEGLSIEVTEDCMGCGECIGACYIDAIETVEGRAVIGDMCRVCGRCALQCRQRAIRLSLENPAAVDDVVERIESVLSF